MANYNKILGFVLLILGLAVIGFAVWHSYNIFTAKTSAPLIFRAPAQIQDESAAMSQDMQKQINDMVVSQFSKMLPANAVPDILNLISWSVFAGILVMAGGQISGLGV